jgi:hypothetical protein
MSTETAAIRIRGRDTTVPSIRIRDRSIIVNGAWLKTASVQDEAFVEGEIVPDPEAVINHLKQWKMKPDIFTFSQKITDPKPKFVYHTEWDDFAVIPITTYDDWFRNRIKKDVRENVRRAKREGVEVHTSSYDDAFVKGIKKLYDETPIRQGKRFWHYGKSFETLKQSHGTYFERAEYLGAYLRGELIGFIKMVYVDNFAKTMHVFGSNEHRHKRPTNALIAKAVEVCVQRKLSFFIYGEYTFPAKDANSLTEFKRRNGFEQMRYPRYFIPLTAKGSLALRLKLHRGLRRHVPASMTNTFLKVRSAYYRRKFHGHLAACSVQEREFQTIRAPRIADINRS